MTHLMGVLPGMADGFPAEETSSSGLTERRFQQLELALQTTKAELLDANRDSMERLETLHIQQYQYFKEQLEALARSGAIDAAKLGKRVPTMEVGVDEHTSKDPAAASLSRQSSGARSSEDSPLPKNADEDSLVANAGTEDADVLAKQSQHIAWIYVLIAMVIEAVIVIVSISQEEPQFNLVGCCLIGCFWLPVWIESLASGSNGALRTMVALLILSFSCLGWAGQGEGVVYPKLVGWGFVGCLVGALVYPLFLIMTARLREMFTKNQLFEQTVRLMGRWLGASTIYLYQAILAISSLMSMMGASNEYCTLTLGESCNRTNCRWQNDACERGALLEWYKKAPEFLRHNATVEMLWRYIKADAYVKDYGKFIQSILIMVSLTTLIIAEVVMVKVRRVGTKTFTENRLLLRERWTFGVVGAHITSSIMLIEVVGKGEIGNLYMWAFLIVYLCIWLTLAFSLAWMVVSSTAIPEKERERRSSTSNESLEMTAACKD